MASQFLSSSLCYPAILSSNRHSLLQRISSPSGVFPGISQSNYAGKFPSFRVYRAAKASSSISDSGKALPHERDLRNVKRRGIKGFEPLRGKPGSISFYGLTHQMVEEGKLQSAPFKPGTGSLTWILAPLVLIASLIVPSLLVGNVVNNVIKDVLLSEMVSSLSTEAAFYFGLATFLRITDHVQRPYLEYSAKRWSLITGLKGYMSSAYFTMGLKIIAPLFAAYVTWPELGLESLVAVAPFLVGCFVQYLFEMSLKFRGSSCWPLVPIIFEVYRVYQLTKASHFVERLLYGMADQVKTPQLMERSNALVGMLVTFQVLGVVCLWSLITFLVRLFPSRPVADNY